MTAFPYCNIEGSVKRIGLISDTHGLLRPQALEALETADLIIHAGDIGKPEVIDAIETLAPVIAVKGNGDSGPWAKRFPANRSITLGGVKLYVIHNLKDLDFAPAAKGYHAVISGHSHKPGALTRSGVLFVNPGSAGPRRFRLPVTVAKLNLSGARLTAEIMELAV